MDLTVINLKRKFINLWVSSENSGTQAARGSALVFLERLIIKGVYFIRTVILARLLFPDDFGLFGLATLSMNVIGVVTNPGFPSAIVQAKDDIRKYLNSIWTMSFLRYALLSLLLFFLVAPLAGNFFHNQSAVPFTRALALLYIFFAFENIGVVLLQKEMKFNRLFFYDISGVIAEVAVSVGSAFILKNAWALVLGTLANKFVSTIFSYIVHPFRPRFEFDLAGARELFKTGKWIGLAGIVSFLVSQGDNLTVGKMIDATALGFYSVAFALATLPAVEISKALGNILFPLFSKLQEDIERLGNAFVRSMRLIFAITIPSAAGLFVLAPEIVKFVYSAKWLPMVPVLCVLVFVGLVKSLDYIINPILVGTGRAKTSTFILIVQSFIMFALMIPLISRLGAIGAAWAVLASLIFAQIISLIKLKKSIGLELSAFLKVTALPILASAIMFLAIALAKQAIGINNIFIFVTFIGGGVLIYFSALLLLDMLFGKKFQESIIWIKQNI